MKKKITICITGALGHIGSALIRELDATTIQRVHLVDNMLTQRFSSLFHLPRTPKYIFHELDILDPDMKEIIKDSDIVIHLAAITDAETSVKKKGLVNRVNKKGLKNVTDLCVKYGVSLLFPSTTSVYGSQSKKVDENCSDAELKPQSPYAESKLWAEKYLAKLGKKSKLHFVILRFGTIFGYSIGMRFHTAVNKFIFQAINGKPITVWRTALKQKRPYCDLDDCVNAINYVIKHRVFDNTIYNIVTMNLTIQDILRHLKKYVPKLSIVFVDSRIMNQLSYEVLNKKSLKRGFKYKGNLSKAMKNTVKALKHVNHLIKKSL